MPARLLTTLFFLSILPSSSEDQPLNGAVANASVLAEAASLAGGGGSSSPAPPTASPSLPAGPVLRIVRPANHSFTVSGLKTLLEMRIDLGASNSTAGLRVPEDVHLCVAMGDGGPVEVGGEGDQCWGDSSPRFLLPRDGAHTIRPYLRSRAPPGSDAGASSPPAAAAVTLVGEPTYFSTGPAPSACNATTFGRAPCMITRPNCNRFLKFKFFLYPTTALPSQQSAALHLALAASPLRTEDPFAACVYIGVGDVRAANVIKEPLEASLARQARLPLWGSGENHIIFTFGDYGPGFDTGRAMVAASSFTPPLQEAWLAARGGGGRGGGAPQPPPLPLRSAGAMT